jgi:hypothetical protein
MHGHDGGDAGVDPARAVLVLLGQPGTRESGLRMASATWRARAGRITVVGQRAVHDQRIRAGRGRSHPGGVLEELRHRDAVCLQHLQRAVAAIEQQSAVSLEFTTRSNWWLKGGQDPIDLQSPF